MTGSISTRNVPVLAILGGNVKANVRTVMLRGLFGAAILFAASGCLTSGGHEGDTVYTVDAMTINPAAPNPYTAAGVAVRTAVYTSQGGGGVEFELADTYCGSEDKPSSSCANGNMGTLYDVAAGVFTGYVDGYETVNLPVKYLNVGAQGHWKFRAVATACELESGQSCYLSRHDPTFTYANVVNSRAVPRLAGRVG